MQFSAEGLKPATSSYLEPGVHLAKIVKVEYFTSKSKGTPGIRFNFLTEDGKTGRHNWYLSEKAWSAITGPALISIFEALGMKDKLESYLIKATDEESLCTVLSEVLTDKTLRWVFGGREYENTNGGISLSTELVFSDFVESPKIALENSRLKFNPDKHIQRITRSTAEAQPEVGFSSTFELD